MWTRVKQEVIHILPIFLFFLLSFFLINGVESYLFETSGISGFSSLQVALAAALIAKIVLVVDHLPSINRFKNHPLAYHILWKTLLYWMALFLVRLCIRFFPFFWDNTRHLEADIQEFSQNIHWNVFLSIQAYYLMLLFIFVVFQELTYKIGVKKMRRLFFG